MSVRLQWWSAWFTVVWVGWWASTAVALVAPTVLRNTLGVVAPELKKYIAFLQPTQRYVTLFTWSIAIFASFQPLVYHRTSATDNTSTGDGKSLYYFSRVCVLWLYTYNYWDYYCLLTFMDPYRDC